MFYPLFCCVYLGVMRNVANFITYKKVFDAISIPNLIVLTKGFFESNEILDCVYFLKALDNCLDDLALISLLKGNYTKTHFDENWLYLHKIEKTSKVGTSATKGEPSEQAKKTAAILTSLFNNDTNKKEAIVQFVNKSKCNLIIKISGKKFYNLTVPSNGQNYILVDKGSYNVSTSICDAVFNQNKALTKDVIITLNGPK